MNNQKNKKKDLQFIEILLSKSKKVSPYESNKPLLEQVIETIFSEGEKDPDKALETMNLLLEDFVDWNEVRIVPVDRFSEFVERHERGDYKLKAIQAFLNKIFSRSGSLDYKFLMDFDLDALEDYLEGIMEMKEATRRRIILRVFKKHILPTTESHEIIFERVGTCFNVGDQLMKETFESYSIEELEGIKNSLDDVLVNYCLSEPKCTDCPLKSVCIEAG